MVATNQRRCGVLFVTLLKVRPGKAEQAFRLFKIGEAPEGISIKTNLGLFGRYDGLVIFEAADSGKAAEFVTKMVEVFETETFAAVTPDQI